MTPLAGFAIVVALSASAYAVARRRGARETNVAQAVTLPPPRTSWTVLAGETEVSAVRRTAMAERLGVLGDAWSERVLEAALDDEHDAAVREAIWRALLAVRSRRAP